MSNPITPNMIAKNFKPKSVQVPLEKRRARQTKPQKVRTVKKWVHKDSYLIKVGDVIRLKNNGPLYLVKVADESPVSVEKVIHCVPTLNTSTKATIFYTGNPAKKKFIWIYETVEVE